MTILKKPLEIHRWVGVGKREMGFEESEGGRRRVSEAEAEAAYLVDPILIFYPQDPRVDPFRRV